MIGAMRVLWLIVVAACAHAGPAPLANMAVAVPAATTTCYRSVRQHGLLMRTVDPSRHVIRERTDHNLVYAVDGDRISARAEHFRVTGQLVGPAWRWTSWSARTTFNAGGWMEFDAVVTPSGLFVTARVKVRSDLAEYGSVDLYETIPCPTTAGS
jgi:hypothetical protein